MKTLSAALICAATLISFNTAADAKGCIKGAIVGGIAGHMAGHGMMGAAGGCAVGHHMAHNKMKRAAATQEQGAR